MWGLLLKLRTVLRACALKCGRAQLLMSMPFLAAVTAAKKKRRGRPLCRGGGQLV